MLILLIRRSRLKLTLFLSGGQTKCVSMVIAETASRNVVYKATKLAESIFERQSEMLISEEDLAARSSVSYEENLEDLGCNADLYVFNDETFEGCSSSYESIQRRSDVQTDSYDYF